MALLNDMTDRFRSLDLESRLGLKPAYPKIAIELDCAAMSLVRLKAKKRGRPLVESYKIQGGIEGGVPATMFDREGIDTQQLAERLGTLFEAAGVRPGKVSLVLPDNLAKLSLLTLPERPPSRKQLGEVIRFQTRRSIPFRVTDAAMSYQLLPSKGKGVQILVALMHRALIERYEQALESIGARPGLVDLCTPNLLNLCRRRINAAAKEGDVAFINCADNYFSLAIVRGGQLVFFRCKTYSIGNGRPGEAAGGVLGRKLGYSLSYYEEKLGGTGIKSLLVRSADRSFEQLSDQLAGLDAERIELIDPVADVESETGQLDAQAAQRIAPALGAAIGRS
jgi:hypothetical protein